METLLVPVDFSRASRRALAQAVSVLGGANPLVILLHVIDKGQIEFAIEHGIAGRRGLLQRMRRNAEKQMRAFEDQVRRQDVRVQSVISVGIPFFEILRKSEDFQVDCIVMGKFGAGTRWEKFFFGTTAEKVARGAVCPVFVVP